MRKLFTVLALAISFLAATGVASAVSPPECGDGCPVVSWPWVAVQ